MCTIRLWSRIRFSGNLNRIKKDIKIEQVKVTFDVCHQLGIRAFANFMFNTPGETEADLQKTLDLAKEINEDGYNFSITTPFPGTDLYSEIELKLNVNEYSLFLDAIRTLTDPRFKLAQHDLNLQVLAIGAHRSFNTLWKRILFAFDKRYIRRIMGSRKKKEYVSAIFFLIKLLMKRGWEHLKFKVRHLNITAKRTDDADRSYRLIKKKISQ